jgi:hypothetical protein
MLNASPTAIDFDVYQPRNPKAARRAYKSLQLGEDECYQGRFGFWRPYVTNVIRRYLASGS